MGIHVRAARPHWDRARGPDHGAYLLRDPPGEVLDHQEHDLRHGQPPTLPRAPRPSAVGGGEAEIRGQTLFLRFTKNVKRGSDPIYERTTQTTLQSNRRSVRV